jgi:hypothetical protein
MPERIYLDTVAFRQFGRAFETKALPSDLRDRFLISPLTVFEVLSQLTTAEADQVLRQVHAILNWTNPKRTGLLPWPDDALFSVWNKKLPPIDNFTARMKKAFNVCLAAESPQELQEDAGKLKDVMDNMRAKTAGDFGRLMDAARQGGFSGESFSKAWFQGIANRVKTDSTSKDMKEIVAALTAYHEFEESKLRVALLSKDYKPEKHQNDLLDAEQLIYLSDPSLCFLTCDSGFRKFVTKSLQAKRIIVAPPHELDDAAMVEVLVRGIVTRPENGWPDPTWGNSLKCAPGPPWADKLIYWPSSGGDYKIEDIPEGRFRPWCDQNRPEWDLLFQEWKERKRFYLWLCKQHAFAQGFLW